MWFLFYDIFDSCWEKNYLFIILWSYIVGGVFGVCWQLKLSRPCWVWVCGASGSWCERNNDSLFISYLSSDCSWHLLGENLDRDICMECQDFKWTGGTSPIGAFTLLFFFFCPVLFECFIWMMPCCWGFPLKMSNTVMFQLSHCVEVCECSAYLWRLFQTEISMTVCCTFSSSDQHC